MPNPQAGGPPLVGCSQLLIQHIHSYPPYVESVSSIRNLRTRHAVVTRVPLNLSSCLLSKNIKIRIYKTIILPVVLYGCETWSLTLREERRVRVFENWMLRRIFGPKRDEVTGDWRKLQNEKLNKF
jgi:hypothetical protein